MEDFPGHICSKCLYTWPEFLKKTLKTRILFRKPKKNKKQKIKKFIFQENSKTRKIFLIRQIS